DNLKLTDNTVILGWNAFLHAKPGLTNFLIDEGLGATNISLYGLNVTGDRFAAYTAPDFLSLIPYPSPYYETNLINHGGMRLDMAGGGTVAGCSAYGFGGYGFMLVARATLSFSAFHDNYAHHNGVGVAVLGSTYEYPAFPYAPLDTWPLEQI